MLCLGDRDIGLCLIQIGTLHRKLRVCLRKLCHGVGLLCPGLVQTHLEVARIDQHQFLAEGRMLVILNNSAVTRPATCADILVVLPSTKASSVLS